MKLTLATNEEINKLYSKFKKFNSHLLEAPKKIYPFIGIMDVFNRVLTIEDASELLGRNHNLKYGSRFLSAITQIYRTNDEVFVHINKNGMSKEQLKFVLSNLNRIEAKFFRKMFATKKGIYKIGDEEALKFLVTLSIEELFFSNFFFPSLETVIIGNYELCFPVYSKTMEGFEKCREIIEHNGLFIRQ